MDKSNEEKLNDLKECILKSISNSTYKLYEPDRDRKIMSEDIVKLINDKLKNCDVPILVEQEDGTRVALMEPKIFYNNEKSIAKIMSFSLVGNPVEREIIDISINDKNCKRSTIIS